MHIKKAFSKENLLIQTEVNDKDELLRKMADLAAKTPEIKASDLDATAIYNAMQQREHQFSTAVGEGLLFPHARFASLHHHAIILIATLKTPLKYDTPDNVPILIACMVLISEDQPMEGLKFIASFAKSLKNPALAKALSDASSPEKAAETLEKMNLKLPETLTAEDIMAPFRLNVTPEMRLRAATRMMAKFGTEAVPVMSGRKLVGQLSCRDLFKKGIPETYSPENTSGRIDPLEQYFTLESSSYVADVMDKSYAAFLPDAPLIDIVFELSIRNRPQVYIVNQSDELLGIIDHNIMLERAVNL